MESERKRLESALAETNYGRRNTEGRPLNINDSFMFREDDERVTYQPSHRNSMIEPSEIDFKLG